MVKIDGFLWILSIHFIPDIDHFASAWCPCSCPASVLPCLCSCPFLVSLSTTVSIIISTSVTISVSMYVSISVSMSVMTALRYAPDFTSTLPQLGHHITSDMMSSLFYLDCDMTSNFLFRDSGSKCHKLPRRSGMRTPSTRRFRSVTSYAAANLAGSIKTLGTVKKISEKLPRLFGLNILKSNTHWCMISPLDSFFAYETNSFPSLLRRQKRPRNVSENFWMI